MKLWVASQNPHKVEEIGQILGPSMEVRSLLDLPGFPDIDESGSTFRENALIKARALWEKVREPVFADDSGLEVDALHGRPGVHSMRYSAPNPTHEKNIDKLLGELAQIPLERRTARFRCCVAFLDAQGREQFFDGAIEGRIAFERRGTGGFGYDPVFFLPDLQKTVAELAPTEKNAISHRGRAVAALKAFLFPDSRT
jgi:XTP/dITP diphosphohydrolase